MARKETLKQFAENFGKFDDFVEREIINRWNQETFEVLGTAQRKAPVRLGDLQGSGRAIKTKITPTGLESFVEFTVPYASRINKGEGISLKPVGHSFRADGSQAKRQEGEIGFLTKAVEEGDAEFVKITSIAVSNGFNKI